MIRSLISLLAAALLFGQNPSPWRTDYAAARAEALAAKRPLLVAFRCGRGPEAKAIDAALETRTDGFVPVRVSSMTNVDLNTFRFDDDLTLAVLVIDPATQTTLARFGTRDADSPSARMSVAGLERFLASARALPLASAPAETPRAKPFTVAEIPGFASTRRARETCYHCHYATDARFARARADGTFRKPMLFRFPLPENLGVTLDVDKNNVVAAVRPGSPAHAAGLRPGDLLRRANDTPVLSSADLQFALDAVADPGRVTLAFTRDGKPRTATLTLPSGWRATDISWRATQGAIPPILGIWEKPEPSASPDGRLALRVTLLFDGDRWKASRGDLRVGDILVGVNGRTLPAMTPPQFHAYIRLNFAAGDTIRLDVLRDGKRIVVPVIGADN